MPRNEKGRLLAQAAFFSHQVRHSWNIPAMMPSTRDPKKPPVDTRGFSDCEPSGSTYLFLPWVATLRISMACFFSVSAAAASSTCTSLPT